MAKFLTRGGLRLLGFALMVLGMAVIATGRCGAWQPMQETSPAASCAESCCGDASCCCVEVPTPASPVPQDVPQDAVVAALDLRFHLALPAPLLSQFAVKDLPDGRVGVAGRWSADFPHDSVPRFRRHCALRL
ncbi:MAG: hypothetical protein KA004_05525 [Verrucomicrobiales bacterium]|nr:hypothetical protein [Verrucomicrobiales bacterium]